MEDLDLQLAPPPDEGNPYMKWIIAAIAMVVIGLLVFLLNPRKVAELSVQKIDFYAPPAVAATPDPVMYPGTTKAAEEDLYARRPIRPPTEARSKGSLFRRKICRACCWSIRTWLQSLTLQRPRRLGITIRSRLVRRSSAPKWWRSRMFRWTSGRRRSRLR
jgi:hypothetical protein